MSKIDPELLLAALEVEVAERNVWHAAHDPSEPCEICDVAEIIAQDPRQRGVLLGCLLSVPLLTLSCAVYFLAGMRYARNEREVDTLEKMFGEGS